MQNKYKNLEEYLYLFACAILTAQVAYTSTMFYKPLLLDRRLALLIWAVIFVKVMVFDRKDTKYFAIAGIVIGVCALIFKFTEQDIWINLKRWALTEYHMVITFLLMVIGAKNVDFKKILKVYIFSSGAVLLAAFVASMVGFIPNLQFVREDGITVRNSFGSVYPTDFSAHILFLMMAYGYLRKGKLKIIEYLVGFIIAGSVYYFCDARNSMIGIVLFLVGYFLIQLCEQKCADKIAWIVGKKFLSVVCMMSMVIGTVLMIVLTKLYSPNNSILAKFPKTVQSRFIMGQEAISKYGIHVFGQKIPMVGAGGKTEWPKNYFFLDCSYVYVLLCYGLLMLTVVLAIYVLLCLKNKTDLYLLYVVAVIAFVCMFEHHLIDLGYNPFTLALFATMNNKNLCEEKEIDEKG